jgi:hypothetical protein
LADLRVGFFLPAERHALAPDVAAADHSGLRAGAVAPAQANRPGCRGSDVLEIEVGGFFGLLLLIATIYAIVRTVQSSASTFVKVAWIVALVVLPLFGLGLVLWLLFGPKR